MDKSKKDKEDESAKKAKLFGWDWGGNASKMMKRMNFQKNTGLGLNGKGIKMPIKAVERPKSMGLGFLGSERPDLSSNTKEEEQNTWDYIYELVKQDDDLVKKFSEEVAELKRSSPIICSSSVQPFVPTGEKKTTSVPIKAPIKVIRKEASTDEKEEVKQCSEEPGPLGGSRSVNAFQKLKKINKNGTVFKAIVHETKEIVALKKIPIEHDRSEFGFPLRGLREINLLLQCNHPCIVKLKEVVVGGRQETDVYMVTEYVEHDLKSLMERNKLPFSTSEVKCLMMQILEGVNYLHRNWILHRDLKPSNLLMNNRGELKVSGFAMARQYGSTLKPYTQMIITQWYRPPELLLGAKEYSTAVDMWSIGCIMAELLSQKPLFQGNSAINQLEKIFEVLGTPSQTIWPGFSSLPNAKAKFPYQPYNMLGKKFPGLSENGFELLNTLLTLDPLKRLTVEEALNHGWFHEVPLPKSRDFMPTFTPKA